MNRRIGGTMSPTVVPCRPFDLEYLYLLASCVYCISAVYVIHSWYEDTHSSTSGTAGRRYRGGIARPQNLEVGCCSRTAGALSPPTDPGSLSHIDRRSHRIGRRPAGRSHNSQAQVFARHRLWPETSSLMPVSWLLCSAAETHTTRGPSLRLPNSLRLGLRVKRFCLRPSTCSESPAQPVSVHYSVAAHWWFPSSLPNTWNPL